MLSQGNGTRQQCAANLVKTVRGEVPFDRMRGVDRRLIDSPSTDPSQIKIDVSWLIKTYEPRIRQTTVKVTAGDGVNGAFSVQLAIE